MDFEAEERWAEGFGLGGEHGGGVLGSISCGFRLETECAYGSNSGFSMGIDRGV